MADTKEAPKAADVPVEAAGAETVPEPETGKPKEIKTSVWAAAGGVPKSSVLQTAIQSVRDAIPVVYQLEAEITGARKQKQGDQEGTSFEVTITYTPRELAGGKQDPVDVDKVVKSLEVPQSFGGIGGHDGDPDFLNPDAK